MKRLREADVLSGSFRVLLVFAPSGSNEKLSAIRTQIHAHSSALTERDMVAIEVVSSEDTVTLVHPRVADAMDGRIPPAERLRSRFSVATNEFRVVLAGKDGGAKLSRGEVVDLAEVFALVDSMPMRRNEMRERGR